MTIKEYVENQKRMSINGWLAQIKKDDLEHLLISQIADSKTYTIRATVNEN